MTRTVGHLLAESLAAHDVDLIYCVPGESYLGLTDALTEFPQIRLIVCRHEGGAGFMAAADGRMRDGRAGVALVSRGPGVTNAMISLHTAFHDATPMVILIGHVERKDVGRLALQEQNYSRLLSDVTKAVFEVIQPIQASEVIARAFHLAQSGTPGPVAVILPEDIFDEPAEGPVVAPRTLPRPGPRAEDLDELAEMIANAERPLVLVGGAMAACGEQGLADLKRLAEAWSLPVSPTHRRPHLFDADHPNYGGYMGIRVPKPLLDEMKKSDLMICLGERLSDSISQSYTFPAAPDPQLPLVQVWPDANEIGRVWRVDLPIAADPHAVIRGLLARNAPEASAGRKALGEGAEHHPSRPAGARMGSHARWRELRRGLRRHVAPHPRRCGGHVGCGELLVLPAPLLPVQADAHVLGLECRRHGGGGAHGGGSRPAPAGQARGGLRGRRRHPDDRQRDRHRHARGRRPGHHPVRQCRLRHDRHAP